MRVVAIVFILLAFLISVAIPRYLGPDDLRGCTPRPTNGKCKAADAIIAVSGGDTIARTSEAVSLYQRGWAPVLIFSGAAADISGPSNALAMKRYAVENGVPENAIVIEEFSQTTAENAVNTSIFIKKQDIKRVVLVTSAYHQRRAELEFGIRLGNDVVIVNHPVATDNQWTKYWWTTGIGWQLAIGELFKIFLFHINRGF